MTAISTLDRLLHSPRFISHLRDLLTQHHRLYRTPAKAEFLEDLVYQALKRTQPDLSLEWSPQSHRVLYDIRIEDPLHGALEVSIKSGAQSKNKLVLSGFRMQSVMAAHKGDAPGSEPSQVQGDAIVEALTAMASKSSTVSISFCPTLRHYQIRPLNSTLLVPPPWSNWTQSGAKIKGTSAAGVSFELVRSLSWQIWWKIPLHLMMAHTIDPFSTVEAS